MEVSRRHAAQSPPGGVIAAIIAAAGLVTVAAAVTVAASFISRMVLVPPTSREEDTEVLGLDRGSGTVMFSRSADAVTPGRYSFWFADGAGHAKVGPIVSESADAVTRELLTVDVGNLEAGVRGRFNGWFYRHPSELAEAAGTGTEGVAGEDFAVEDVVVETELGPAPAWLVRARERDEAAARWVIQVHGRAVTRAETIRAIPVFRDAGYNCLLISYRNDAGAPRSPDGRYALGDTEWRDVDAAMKFALSHGARSIVLMGWSMGGGMVLQALTRSPRADAVRGLVLDSPVVDWVTALDFQGKSMGLIGPLRSLVYAMMSHAWGRVFTGQSKPLDLARLDFVRRAGELFVPILILHSDDDLFVPSSASHALARKRPDIVTLAVFETARHTKLWNFDRKRWNRVIAGWLARLEEH